MVWVFVDYHGQLLVIECKAVAKVSLRKQSSYICASHQSHQFSWSMCFRAAVTVFSCCCHSVFVLLSQCFRAAVLMCVIYPLVAVELVLVLQQFIARV